VFGALATGIQQGFPQGAVKKRVVAVKIGGKRERGKIRSMALSCSSPATCSEKLRTSSRIAITTARLEPNRLYGVARLTLARLAMVRIDSWVSPVSRIRSRAAAMMRKRRSFLARSRWPVFATGFFVLRRGGDFRAIAGHCPQESVRLPKAFSRCVEGAIGGNAGHGQGKARKKAKARYRR
jgi:hypothetical protein